MDPFARAMHLYPYVFHPTVTLGGGLLLLIHREWALQGADRAELRRRVGAFLVAGLLALLPTAAYALVSGKGPMKIMEGNAWQVDALIAGGIAITAAVVWYLWRRFEWGTLVPGAVQALVLVTVPYVALSPFWNVSGHVIFALMPTLYLALVARRFWPLLTVPIVMVPNRPYLGAHTWAQAVGGFLVAAAVVLGVRWYRTGSVRRPHADVRRID